MAAVDTSKFAEFKNTAAQMQGVKLFIFTSTGGLMGAMGHNLRLACNDFSFFFDVAEKKMKVGVFKAASVVVVHPVDAQKNEELKKTLSPSDKETIGKNALSKDVLDVEKFPEVTFEVAQETKKNVTGTLTLHGASNMIKLSIEEFPQHFAVKCPLSQPQFGMTPYSAMMGSIKVAPQVDIQLEVPKAVYNDGKWWF